MPSLLSGTGLVSQAKPGPKVPYNTADNDLNNVQKAIFTKW
jgi:hypothetical protein